MARAVLRNRVTAAAEQAQDEAGFFARLREAGVLVRLRFSEINPGEVTGYAVALPGHTARTGTPVVRGRSAGGRADPAAAAPPAGSRTAPAPPRAAGSFRFTAPEREAFYRHAARQAADGRGAHPAQRRRTIRPRPPMRPGRRPPRSMRRPERSGTRRCAAPQTATTARPGWPTGRSRSGPARGTGCAPPRGCWRWSATTPMAPCPRRSRLAANLVSLATAVGELRQAQQHAAQAAAARQAAEHLYASLSQTRAGAAALGIPVRPGQTRTARRPGDAARHDFPMPTPARAPLPAEPSLTDPHASRSPARSAPSRARPRR